MGGFSGQRHLLFVGLPLALYCSDCPHLYQVLQRMRGLASLDEGAPTAETLRQKLDHDGRPYSVLVYALMAAWQALFVVRHCGISLEPLAPKGGALIFRGLWVPEEVDEHWAEHTWSFNSFSRSVEGVLSVLGFYGNATGSAAEALAMKDAHILILVARFQSEAGGGRWALPVQLFGGGENAFPASIEQEVLVPPFCKYHFLPQLQVCSTDDLAERQKRIQLLEQRWSLSLEQAAERRLRTCLEQIGLALFLSPMASWSAVKADGPVPEGDHVGVWPLDEHNVRLLDAVHPKDWAPPERPETFVYDLIALGAGAGGLVSAKQSARRGAKSALIEMHLAGGDCLNVGCVPSKALLRCARAVAEVRRSSELGMAGTSAAVHFERVMERMRRLRADIAPVDAHTTSRDVGVDVYMGKACFTGKNELKVGERTLRFRKAVIATGGRARVPPISGLDSVPYLTNASLFNLTKLPPRLVILGAGPISLEMAQAFGRFGSRVTVLEVAPEILGAEDADAKALLQQVLEEEGIEIRTNCMVTSVAHKPAAAEGEWPEIQLQLADASVHCEAFLVAAGRVPNVEGLGLEAAGVDCAASGVKVNDDLTTTNPDILAVGDVIERVDTRFTHMSGTMAGMAVQNALFPGQGLPVNAPSGKLSEIVVPRCTYTEPEIASCGVSNEKLASRQNLEVDVFKASIEHNDRAILEGSRRGYVKILCRKGTEEIIGATIVAEHAGEMLAEITLAIQHRLGLSQIAHTVHPYPTLGEAVQQCALNYNRARWAKMQTKAGYS
ncbi:unnamed protein product [Durusdinium trenchii]